MFDNVFGKSIFGKVQPGMCRLTANGQIAVKTSGGYKSYNIEKKKLTNQSNFVFDIGEDFFFVIPTNKAKTGDIILVNGKPRCVVSATKDKIEVVNYEDSTLETVLPERHVFMGNTYFYGKIVSFFGSSFGKKGASNNMLKTMFQFQMMQSMLGGKKEDGSAVTSPLASLTGGAGNGDMMQTMMLMSMFNGNSGGFGSMFENMFDFDDDDDDEEEKTIKKLMDEEEEE